MEPPEITYYTNANSLVKNMLYLDTRHVLIDQVVQLLSSPIVFNSETVSRFSELQVPVCTGQSPCGSLCCTPEHWWSQKAPEISRSKVNSLVKDMLNLDTGNVVLIRPPRCRRTPDQLKNSTKNIVEKFKPLSSKEASCPVKPHSSQSFLMLANINIATKIFASSSSFIQTDGSEMHQN